MARDIETEKRSTETSLVKAEIAAESSLAGVRTGTGRTAEEVRLVELLRDTHRARATNLISIFPETPACAAAVFEALDKPSALSSGLRFIARAMRSAADKIDLRRDIVAYRGHGYAAESDLEREIWQNHHLLKRLLRASPELRRIIEALREIVAAPGIINRLGEPGFVEALGALLIEELGRHAPLFQGDMASIEKLVDVVAARMNDFYPEFTAESLANISPSSAILRRAGYHEHCAKQLDDRKAA